MKKYHKIFLDISNLTLNFLVIYFSLILYLEFLFNVIICFAEFFKIIKTFILLKFESSLIFSLKESSFASSCIECQPNQNQGSSLPPNNNINLLNGHYIEYDLLLDLLIFRLRMELNIMGFSKNQINKIIESVFFEYLKSSSKSNIPFSVSPKFGEPFHFQNIESFSPIDYRIIPLNNGSNFQINENSLSSKILKQIYGSFQINPGYQTTKTLERVFTILKFLEKYYRFFKRMK